MKNHKLCYTSSYDRGLEYILAMWPDIKKKYKDAELHCAYGWNTFDTLLANNPERQAWKKNMVCMMQQEGITDHGRIGKEELKKLRQECGILAYPSHFFEIFCISVVEAQLDGVVPLTTSIGALPETNKCGIIVEGDITKSEVQQKYLQELLSLMGDERRRSKMSKEGMEWAKQFDWKNISRDWTHEFVQKDESVKLTVYTPTIRKGWLNIMADNLSKQNYKHFEWIIVDDAKEDRTEIVKEYAIKYNLDIKYVHGKKRTTKRRYGLCNANNTVLALATGEVLVFLQDFILMPLDGLEQIATLYKRYPMALQGLPDMYFEIKKDIPVDIEKEDWFNGRVDVIGEFIRQNIRIQNAGLRKSDNCSDFEQNYGAIPVKVARELGGWWEFYDEALGFDNTDIGFRAMTKGYPLIIDETNVAICLNLWPVIGEKEENGGSDRGRRLNDPRYFWMKKQIQEGKLPLIRTQEIDDKIELLYDIPQEVKTDDAPKWVEEHQKEIIDSWKR